MNNKKSRSVVIIPARYASVRFPGKVIAKLGGKPIIELVHEKALASKADDVYVAVDDTRVAEVVDSFGGKAIMTRSDHPSGSDRIWEVSSGIDCDIIVNIQGDEPMVPPEVIDNLIDRMLADTSLQIGTVAVPCSDREALDNSNVVKVVFDSSGKALYFSRSAIPFLRTDGEDTQLYRHWGIYAYRKESLARFVALPEGRLEKCEKLEQLRALENGIDIDVIVSDIETIGIDTPEDLERAEKYISKQ